MRLMPDGRERELVVGMRQLVKVVIEGLTARTSQTLGKLTTAASERSGNLDVAEVTLVKMYTDVSEIVCRLALRKLDVGAQIT